jgi:membrane-associated phospholipid phosphatase
MILTNINAWRARPLAHKLNFPELAVVLGLLAAELALGSRLRFEFDYDTNLRLATPLLFAAGLSSVLGLSRAIIDTLYFMGLWFIAVVVGGPLAYYAAMPGFELHDTTLAAADRLIGFHWPDWAAFIHSHESIERMLKWSYASIGMQAFASTFYFGVRSMTARNLELFWVGLVSLTITLTVFALYPALGPIPYFNVKSETAPYLPHLLQLRDGTLHSLLSEKVQGIVSFPSYHTACAGMFMYVHRRQKYVFPVVVVLNTLMLLSTPSTGGHYLIDILAGFVVVAVSIAIVRYVLTKRHERDIGR